MIINGLKKNNIMKIEIRIGDYYNGKRINYNSDYKLDNPSDEKNNIYKFLSFLDNCVVENVDIFLLYALNNGLTAFNVKNNADDDDHEFHSVPKFDPSIYKVFVIYENGEEINIQDTEGTIKGNYFDKLMKEIMNDFYSCLIYYQYDGIQ